MAGFGEFTRQQPFEKFVAISPSDTVDLTTPTNYILVGGAGDLVIIDMAGNTVTLKGLLAGTIYPIKCTRVKSTDTTATNLVACSH